LESDVFPTPIGPSTVINGTGIRSPPSSIIIIVLFILTYD
jgi:hypothetical protein